MGVEGLFGDRGWHRESCWSQGVWWQRLGVRFEREIRAHIWQVKAVIVCFGWSGAGLEMVILIGVV
ncbi:hypothetical protein A6P54_19200 [Bacillus sp. MKU004]|nr:hypothetical protein A6P54_19200 [Bacillus sp. MKU004]